MSFFIILQSIWILAILVLAFVKYKWSVALYLAYFFLVPYLDLNILGIGIKWNTINLFLLITFAFYRGRQERKDNIEWKPIIPFLIYFVVTLIFIPVQDSLPVSIQFAYWRSNALSTLTLPFIIWNLVRVDPKSLTLYRNVVLICIAIAVIYGVALTSFGGLNPYTMMLAEINGVDFRESYLSADATGRLFGRITSVFNHPMMFGMFLGLSMAYIYSLKNKVSTWIVWVISLLVIINAMVCGVRTVLVSMILSVVIYILYHRSGKTVGLGLMFIFAVYILVINIPEFAAIFDSIINSNDSEIEGSSLSMRLSQFQGCIKEVENCFLEGKGYSWTAYYCSTNGPHPVCWAFESLFFYLLCNNGLIGIALWVYMMYIIIKSNKKYSLEQKSILNTLLFFYLIYTLVTGEYGYMKYYLLFSTLISSEFVYNPVIPNKSIQND